MAKALGVKPDAVAGHSLGEFSALVVAGALSFEDGLKLVSKRAMAMQAACEAQPGTMAAILGLEDKRQSRRSAHRSMAWSSPPTTTARASWSYREPWRP